MVNRKLHCCANLTFLFKDEEDVLRRFRKAKEAGFQAVEYAFPAEQTISDLVRVQKENHLVTAMMSCCLLESKNGLAAIPGMESQFMKSLEKSIEYCNALRCSRLHVLAGLVEHPTRSHDQTYEQNIRIAVDMCQAEGITVLIEPITPARIPNYYLDSFEKAVKLIEKINSPNLKLLVDFYHLQRLSGDLTENLKVWFPLIDHIQVAQIPNRDEPDTPGEIDFKYIFDLLSELNYNKYIGLEYHPRNDGDFTSGMGFIDKMGLTLKKIPSASS